MFSSHTNFIPCEHVECQDVFYVWLCCKSLPGCAIPFYLPYICTAPDRVWKHGCCLYMLLNSPSYYHPSSSVHAKYNVGVLAGCACVCGAARWWWPMCRRRETARERPELKMMKMVTWFTKRATLSKHDVHTLCSLLPPFLTISKTQNSYSFDRTLFILFVFLLSSWWIMSYLIGRRN